MRYLIDDDPWILFVGVPLVPVALIAGRFRLVENIVPFIPPIVFAATLNVTWPPPPPLVICALPYAHVLYKAARLSLFRHILLGADRRGSVAGGLSASASASLLSPQDDGAANDPRAQDGVMDDAQWALAETSPIRAVLGALIFPLAGMTVGNLFFRRLVPDTFHRALLGSCVFLVARDLTSLYYAYTSKWWKKERRLLDYVEIMRQQDEPA